MKIPNAIILLLAANLTQIHAQSPPPDSKPPTNPLGGPPRTGFVSAVTERKPRQVRIFPLKYAHAVELREKVQTALSPDGSLTPDERTNTLIANDEPENIASLSTLIEALDIAVAEKPGTKIDSTQNSTVVWESSKDYSALGNLFKPAGGSHAGSVADNIGPIISFTETDPKILAETAEDLNIFGFLLKRNLDRSLGEEKPNQKMGIQMPAKPGGRLEQAFYIEGFGICFNLRVHFPLLPPATPEPKKETPPADSEWQKARSALYGDGNRSTAGADPYQDSDPIAFDEHLVEALKNRVIESLKNATNLRHLQPEEWIVVNITGGPNTTTRQNQTLSSYLANPADPRSKTVLYASQLHESVSPTVMTLRIQKKALDQSAGSSLEQFQQAVEVHTHVGIARHTASSGNSGENWAQAVELWEGTTNPFFHKQ